MISWLTSASKPVLLGIVAVWGVAIMGTLVGVAVLKSSIERAERLSHLTEDELFESLARQREANAIKTENRSENPSSEHYRSRSKRRLISASVRADAADESTEESLGESDASATSEETR